MSSDNKASSPQFAPVILAGGSGTRFWPRSRRARAKQVLALDGERTMIQQTMDRLLPLAAAEDLWVITNDLLSDTICGQLPEVPGSHVLCEPAARNTAPAAALAAFLLERKSPEIVIGIFPSDHVVKNVARFHHVIGEAVQLAAAGENIVVLGVPPTRPETGYGYIEMGEETTQGGVCAKRVKRFTEKPDHARAEAFLSAGNYAWNSGIFVWSARTLANAIREHSSQMVPLLEKIAAAHGTPEFTKVFVELYPQCQNISVDYAVLEPRSAKGEEKSNLYCLPADFGWNDLGSWAALHEHQMASPDYAASEHANVVEAAGNITVDAKGNYVFAPGKTVAIVGVSDLVIVETDDALLITTRNHSQDVGKVVRLLAERGKEELI